jgi:hypothetical protein
MLGLFSLGLLFPFVNWKVSLLNFFSWFQPRLVPSMSSILLPCVEKVFVFAEQRIELNSTQALLYLTLVKPI